MPPRPVGVTFADELEEDMMLSSSNMPPAYNALRGGKQRQIGGNSNTNTTATGESPSTLSAAQIIDDLTTDDEGSETSLSDNSFLSLTPKKNKRSKKLSSSLAGAENPFVLNFRNRVLPPEGGGHRSLLPNHLSPSPQKVSTKRVVTKNRRNSIHNDTSSRNRHSEWGDNNCKNVVIPDVDIDNENSYWRGIMTPWEQQEQAILHAREGSFCHSHQQRRASLTPNYDYSGYKKSPRQTSQTSIETEYTADYDEDFDHVTSYNSGSNRSTKSEHKKHALQNDERRNEKEKPAAAGKQVKEKERWIEKEGNIPVTEQNNSSPKGKPRQRSISLRAKALYRGDDDDDDSEDERRDCTLSPGQKQVHAILKVRAESKSPLASSFIRPSSEGEPKPFAYKRPERRKKLSKWKKLVEERSKEIRNLVSVGDDYGVKSYVTKPKVKEDSFSSTTSTTNYYTDEDEEYGSPPSANVADHDNYDGSDDNSDGSDDDSDWRGEQNIRFTGNNAVSKEKRKPESKLSLASSFIQPSSEEPIKQYAYKRPERRKKLSKWKKLVKERSEEITDLVSAQVEESSSSSTSKNPIIVDEVEIMASNSRVTPPASPSCSSFGSNSVLEKMKRSVQEDDDVWRGIMTPWEEQEQAILMLRESGQT